MLVITIIVIIILAAAVILTISQNNPVENAKEAKVKNDIKTMQEELILKVSEKLLESDGDISDLNGAAELKLSSATGYPGKFVIENGKLQVTSSATAEEKEAANELGIASVTKWEITTDNDSDGAADIGDLLAPTVEGLENEKFYVIADDGTTLTLLAAQNVDTDDTSNTYNQQSSAAGAVAFDEESNVYNESDIQGLVNAYVETLNELDLENVEVAYDTEPVADVKGRLMWYEEADNTTSPFKDAENYSDILYGTNYWLGSSNEDDEGYVWYVYGGDVRDISCNYCYSGETFGVRPVIKILKSSIE